MQACNCNKAVLSLANSQQTDSASVAAREDLQCATCCMATLASKNSLILYSLVDSANAQASKNLTSVKRLKGVKTETASVAAQKHGSGRLLAHFPTAWTNALQWPRQAPWAKQSGPDQAVSSTIADGKILVVWQPLAGPSQGALCRDTPEISLAGCNLCVNGEPMDCICAVDACMCTPAGDPSPEACIRAASQDLDPAAII